MNKVSSGAAVDLSVTLGKMKLKNPVMPASGTFGYGREFADFINLDDLGAVIVKGTTLRPRLGSFQHRLLEIPGGSLCSIGIQNVGVDSFIADKLPYLRQFNVPVIVNIAGESVEEFARVTEILSKAEGVAGIEINISCPNVKKGGMHFGVDPDATFAVVRAVKGATDLTVMPKLTPNVTDVTVFARACEEAGADAISLINGLVGMAIDVDSRRSKLGKNLTGGVTGPCLKPIALRMVWQVAQVVGIPVVGVGGIACPEDALEFILAGASAVEVGTYNLVNPRVMIEIIEGIRDYLIKKGVSDLAAIRGSFES
ncbi:MAG: dihydroorotate dehydrogenase [Dehalococcoidia bacterium]|nr:dihydroorotate dehydrogenase [Dehalococcoidia bacterium]